MTDRSKLGEALEEGLKEALAWKRGEIALDTVNIDPMPPERIRAIHKGVAKAVKPGGRGGSKAGG